MTRWCWAAGRHKLLLSKHCGVIWHNKICNGQKLFLNCWTVSLFSWFCISPGVSDRWDLTSEAIIYLPFSVLIFQMLWTERKQIIRYDPVFVYSLLSRPDLEVCKCIKIFPSYFCFSYPAKDRLCGHWDICMRHSWVIFTFSHVLFRRHTTGICRNENLCQKSFILGKKMHLPSCVNRPINFSITVSKHMKFRIIFLDIYCLKFEFILLFQWKSL